MMSIGVITTAPISLQLPHLSSHPPQPRCRHDHSHPLRALCLVLLVALFATAGQEIEEGLVRWDAHGSDMRAAQDRKSAGMCDVQS